jgi:DNA-binding IclR family transcriptional regulator
MWEVAQWKSDPGKRVLVIGKAVAILESFLAGADEMSLTEIGTLVGLGPSTCHRLLGTLEFHRLVERTATGRYRLGLRLFQLGSLVQVPQALAKLAEPVMRAMADRMEIGAFLSIRDRDRAVCIARVDRGQVILAPYRVGETLPLHVGAAPIILLAAMSDTDVEEILRQPLEQLTAKTVTDVAIVRRRIAEIRQRGHAVAVEGDLALGLSAVGAPIHDPGGRVVAAVSLSGIASQINAHEATMVAAVVEGARAIESDLAHGELHELAAGG